MVEDTFIHDTYIHIGGLQIWPPTLLTAGILLIGLSCVLGLVVFLFQRPRE